MKTNLKGIQMRPVSYAAVSRRHASDGSLLSETYYDSDSNVIYYVDHTKPKQKMKLWLLFNNATSGYDTYDSCVVAAPDEATAKNIHPDGAPVTLDQRLYPSKAWASNAEGVESQYIGETDNYDEPCVICASFNAG